MENLELRKRFIDERCMLCFVNLVNRQPLINMPVYKYKKGNFLCKNCRFNCKNRTVKCRDCDNKANNFLILEDDNGCPYLGKFCERCI